MTKFLAWWKKDGRYLLALKALLAALLPVFCCMVYCASQGKSIGQVYLPSSEWNDELYYFKQMEGIVKYGYPQGYFGFNESHALKLSFAAWSPVLVFPWILWGLLFGWNLMSPVICNIVLMTIAMAGFVLLVRPSWKQEGLLGVLFCLYTPFVRYMLSGMPEIICFSMLILFYALAISWLRKERWSKLIILLLMGVVMTWMRPYLLLFLLLPLFFLVKKMGWKGILAGVPVLGCALAGYAMIKHYFGAEYFADLFFTDWVTAFFEQGFFGGVHYFFGKLYYMGKAFLGHTIQGFRTGLASGAFFAGFLAVMAVLAIQSFVDFWKYRADRRKWKLEQTEAGKETAEAVKKTVLPELFYVELHLLISFVGMFFALLLMYKLTEGSKHLLTFIAVGIFIVSLMKTRFFKKIAFLGVTFVFFYSVMAVDPYDYQVPFTTTERQTQVETWQNALQEKMTLTRENVPSFDNVVIWVLWDDLGEERISSKWQLLYALPEGCGISCCEGSYVEENLETLESRYLATIADGRVDALCRDAGYLELMRDKDLVLYQRR